MESRPENIWLRHKKSLESFLRLMQQLIMMSEYRPEPTLDNPLMILLLRMHAGVIIAIWEGEKNYVLGKNLNTFTSEHDNTNMESYTSVTGENIATWAWELLQVFYPNVEYHVNEKKINVCHLYVCKSAPNLHFFPVVTHPQANISRTDFTTMQTIPNINYKGSKPRRF
jgi:hypothetical protein